MTVTIAPAPYPDWREEPNARAEDAAYTFGDHLIVHCRDEALAKVSADASWETRAAVEGAVDVALHNLMDMLEGFWFLGSGGSHSVEYVLQVRVRDSSGTAVETVDISPSKLDLPIGYWKWVREREFK